MAGTSICDTRLVSLTIRAPEVGTEIVLPMRPSANLPVPSKDCGPGILKEPYQRRKGTAMTAEFWKDVVQGDRMEIIAGRMTEGRYWDIVEYVLGRCFESLAADA